MRALFAWACVLALSARGSAQSAPGQGFRLDRFPAPPTSRDGFAVTLPSVLDHLTWSTQLTTAYELAPLVLRDASKHPVVEHRLSGAFTAALGLWRRLEVYARLPVTWLSTGQSPRYEQRRFEAPGGFALGDVALGATGLAFAGRGLQLGGRGELLLPTGNRTQLAGDSALAPRLMALASYTHDQLLIAVNGGYLYRPHRDYGVARIGDELEWSAALRFDSHTGYEFALESFGTIGLRDRKGAGAADTLDLLVGGRKTADTGAVRMRVGAALGGGLSAAYGDPALRAMLTLGVEPRPPEAALPTKPLDSDGDWIVDDRDECPQAPEDLDGFQDDDGCPDEDDDGDGVLDRDDACPRRAGDFARGCPEPDADADGVPDTMDRCPQDAEDTDGDHDTDGCPERDSDGDGLTDDQDACPDVPGSAAFQGCRELARFAGDQILLRHPPRFHEGELAPEDTGLVDDVAALLMARPRLYARLNVIGPALELANARVRALIAALVARGIAAERLSGSGKAATDREQVTIRLEGAPPTPVAP